MSSQDHASHAASQEPASEEASTLNVPSSAVDDGEACLASTIGRGEGPTPHSPTVSQDTQEARHQSPPEDDDQHSSGRSPAGSPSATTGTEQRPTADTPTTGHGENGTLVLPPSNTSPPAMPTLFPSADSILSRNVFEEISAAGFWEILRRWVEGIRHARRRGRLLTASEHEIWQLIDTTLPSFDDWTPLLHGFGVKLVKMDMVSPWLAYCIARC